LRVLNKFSLIFKKPLHYFQGPGSINSSTGSGEPGGALKKRVEQNQESPKGEDELKFEIEQPEFISGGAPRARKSVWPEGKTGKDASVFHKRNKAFNG
jgi:hypothetical protein